jgi:hypothetical protein
MAIDSTAVFLLKEKSSIEDNLAGEAAGGLQRLATSSSK